MIISPHHAGKQSILIVLHEHLRLCRAFPDTPRIVVGILLARPPLFLFLRHLIDYKMSITLDVAFAILPADVHANAYGRWRITNRPHQGSIGRFRP